MPPPIGKGAISVAFVRLSVCPSVRPSVAYIANNSRTERPSMPQFERNIPHLWCDSHTSFKVKRSRSPGPLMLTHIVCHIFWMARPTNLNLVYGWRTTTRISHRHHYLQGQRSRSQGHRDLSEPSWPNAVPVSLEAGGGIPCRLNSMATLLAWFQL